MPPHLSQKFGPQIIIIVSPIIERIHTFYESRGRGAAERLPLERLRRDDLFPGMLQSVVRVAGDERKEDGRDVPHACYVASARVA